MNFYRSCSLQNECTSTNSSSSEEKRWQERVTFVFVKEGASVLSSQPSKLHVLLSQARYARKANIGNLKLMLLCIQSALLRIRCVRKRDRTSKDQILTRYPYDLAAFAHFAEFIKFDLAWGMRMRTKA